MNKDELINILKGNDIIDLIELEGDHILVSSSNKNDLIESEINDSFSMNISLPIALAVTAYARIHMSKFFNENTLYTDTDSIATTETLPDNLIGKGLGKMKLERVFTNSAFPAVKVYGGIELNTKKEYVKVRGYKNPLSFSELKSLNQRSDR